MGRRRYASGRCLLRGDVQKHEAGKLSLNIYRGVKMMAKKVLFVIVIVLFLAMAVFFTTTGKAMVGVGEMPPGETSGKWGG